MCNNNCFENGNNEMCNCYGIQPADGSELFHDYLY